MRNIKILFHILVQTIKGSLSYRFDFWMQVVFMMVNNFFLYLNFYFFFAYQGTILGITYMDFLGQVAFISVFAGTLFFAFMAMTELHEYIADGSFDTVLLTPGNPALTFLAKRTHPSAFGDIVTGFAIGIFVFSPLQFAAMLAVSIVAIFVSIGFSILFASSSFFFGGRANLWESLASVFISTGLYPKEPFESSILRYVLYTVVPTGIAVYGPVQFLRTFDFSYLIPLAVGGVLVWTVALYAFDRGIRRYESGNLSVKSV